jgi:ABC transporter ATM
MNSADNKAAAKSVDSLLNFEAVKYFGNEAYETKQYDAHLQRYEVAGIKTAQSLGALNVGQNAIFSIALTGMMWLAASGINDGRDFYFSP